MRIVQVAREHLRADRFGSVAEERPAERVQDRFELLRGSSLIEIGRDGLLPEFIKAEREACRIRAAGRKLVKKTSDTRAIS